jgi:hypothetical protein
MSMSFEGISRSVALAVMFAVAGCSNPSRDSEPPPQPTTVDIQGAAEWKQSPHLRAYYDATVATFANGTDIDVDAYEARSFDIFREFARANGRSEQGMVDHLKLIPRQVVDIVKADPSVLQSYDAFWAALAGPD